jgi:hypothetical protein
MFFRLRVRRTAADFPKGDPPHRVASPAIQQLASTVRQVDLAEVTGWMGNVATCTSPHRSWMRRKELLDGYAKTSSGHYC